MNNGINNTLLFINIIINENILILSVRDFAVLYYLRNSLIQQNLSISDIYFYFMYLINTLHKTSTPPPLEIQSLILELNREQQKTDLLLLQINKKYLQFLLISFFLQNYFKVFPIFLPHSQLFRLFRIFYSQIYDFCHFSLQILAFILLQNEIFLVFFGRHYLY